MLQCSIPYMLFAGETVKEKCCAAQNLLSRILFLYEIKSLGPINVSLAESFLAYRKGAVFSLFTVKPLQERSQFDLILAPCECAEG